MAKAISYLREVRAELKKVLWPGRRETAVFTIVVLISVAMMAILIWAMDLVLGQLLKLIISR